MFRLRASSTCALQMVGLGTLSKNAAGGRLRIAVRSQKQKLSAKTQKRAKQYAAHGAAGAGTVSGLSSSLAFTPVQVQRHVGHALTPWRDGTPGIPVVMQRTHLAVHGRMFHNLAQPTTDTPGPRVPAASCGGVKKLPTECFTHSGLATC